MFRSLLPHLIGLFLLLLPFAGHAGGGHLLVRDRAVAVHDGETLRVSFDGGETFRAVAFEGIRAIALTPQSAHVAHAKGLHRVSASGQARAIRLPASAGPIAQVAAGADWLLAIPDHHKYALLRRGGRWTRILPVLERGGHFQIDAFGNTVAQYFWDAACGGGGEGFVGVWRPDGPARGFPSAMVPGSASADRDWLLGECDAHAHDCLYSPRRTRYALPGKRRRHEIEVAPGSEWFAISAWDEGGDRVEVYRREGRALVEVDRPFGSVVGARRDGVTVLTAERRLVRIGAARVELPPPPAGVDAFDIDPRGRIYGLGAPGLFALEGATWTRLDAFAAARPAR